MKGKADRTGNAGPETASAAQLRLVKRREATGPGLLHSTPAELERFFRGELPKAVAAAVVRHLLERCPECLAVIRGLWELGEQPMPRLPKARPEKPGDAGPQKPLRGQGGMPDD